MLFSAVPSLRTTFLPPRSKFGHHFFVLLKTLDIYATASTHFWALICALHGVVGTTKVFVIPPHPRISSYAMGCCVKLVTCVLEKLKERFLRHLPILSLLRYLLMHFLKDILHHSQHCFLSIFSRLLFPR